MNSKKTIMLVDDEESILFSLQRILELSGNYEIITAQNGREALLKIRRLPPDLIISDVHMPEMDGLELCKKIREKEITRAIPFIFLTAVKDSMVQGLKIGADDFIKKPFSLDEVLAKIEAMFRRVDRTKEQASQFKGTLEEYPLETLLDLCLKENLTGNLIMQQKENFGRIEIEAGDIKKVIFQDLAEDEALDTLLKWEQGIFVLQSSKVGINFKALKKSFAKKEKQKRNQPVEIAEQVWLINCPHPGSLLQSNVFLRRFRSENKVINFLIDPGAPADLEKISAKISMLTGDFSRIHIYSLSQPDVDVCMNGVYVGQANPKAVCLTTEENWRFINHYQINPKSVKLINTFKKDQVKLSTGQVVRFIRAPFCHARGAFMTYDPESRILFSGDLFAGLCDAQRLTEIYAREKDWDGVRAFQQMYMPSGKAVRNAVQQIRKLDPAPLIIAPQHGLLWRGAVMERFLERICNLDVGPEVLSAQESAEDFEVYTVASNELISAAASFLPLERMTQKIEQHPSLLSHCDFKEGRLQKIFSRPHEVYENLISVFTSGEDVAHVNRLKSSALKIAHEKGLPAPQMEWDSEPTLSIAPEHLFDED